MCSWEETGGRVLDVLEAVEESGRISHRAGCCSN